MFLFWIDSLKTDTGNYDYKEKLIDTFLNAVYLYDDGYIDIGTNLIKGTKRITGSTLEQLSAPLKRTSISYWSPFYVYLNTLSNPSTYFLKLIPLTSSMCLISKLLNSG